MSKVFLTAEWRKLLLINYAIDPSILIPFVPANTVLDLWNDKCYVSLVGFMFINTKLKGFPIPFHTDFPEVNLRFYVRYKEQNEWKRGVVFIKEIVPKPALTFVANAVYGEHYETMKMRHHWSTEANVVIVKYEWMKQRWHSIDAVAESNAKEIAVGSEEEFITEHYWGYTKLLEDTTSEYKVEHPRWLVYPVKKCSVNVDFGVVYGDRFDFLRNEKPLSVFLAEGSEIVVRGGRKIRG